LAVGSLQDAKVSVTLAQPEEPDCPLVGVSKGFQFLTGYARDEVLGRNCRFLNRGCAIPQEDRLRLRACARTGRGFSGLLQNRRKNGEVFLNFVCINTLRVGSNFYLLGFQVDMTHQQDDMRMNAQHLVQVELETLVAAILQAQADALSRLQALENFDSKAWLLHQEYAQASCFASLETQGHLLTKNTFLEVEEEDEGQPLRRAVSDSKLEVEGSGSSEGEARSKTLKILKDGAEWLHEKVHGGRDEDDDREDEEASVPSVGSLRHPENCTPCSFHCYSLSGCNRGEACEFCHREHARRPKKKRLARGKKKHAEEVQ